VIGWGARGTDSDWLWPIGISLAAFLIVGSIALAVAGIINIATHRERLKGIGFAVLTLLLNAGAIAALLAAFFMAAQKVR
jgi:hypothetical protein